MADEKEVVTKTEQKAKSEPKTAAAPDTPTEPKPLSMMVTGKANRRVSFAYDKQFLSFPAGEVTVDQPLYFYMVANNLPVDWNV